MCSSPALLRRLARGGLTCDLSDAGDKVGVLPLTFGWRNHETPFIGVAFTVEAPEGDLEAVYAGLEAPPGSVLVVATGGTSRAVWGETTTRLAQERGLAGAILDGACRDVKAVREAALPVVARGVHPKRAARSGRGKLGGTLSLYGVTIRPGDVVVSDENGSVIVPQEDFGTLADQLLLQEEKHETSR